MSEPCQCARCSERALIVAYMRHMADLRPADANGLRVIAADVQAHFHHDPELNPAARTARERMH